MSNISIDTPSPTEAQLVSIDEHSLSYETFSQGDKIYIFLNGWCSVRYFWTPYFDDFRVLGKCITLDLLGHFPSKVGSNFSELNFNDILTIQSRAIKALSEDKKVTLIGHSTGGMFALAIGALYPDLVEKAVAITPVVHGPTMGIFHLAKVLADLHLNVSLEIFFDLIRNLPTFFHKWFEAATYEKSEFVNRKDIGEFILNYHSHFIKLDPNIMGRYLQVLHDSDIRPLVKESQLDALIIGASDDPIVPVSQQRDISLIMKNSTYVEITPSGHIPTLERRDETISLILKYLQN
jgi:pimeloyl-ACP methyl ester carboxylesterase